MITKEQYKTASAVVADYKFQELEWGKTIAKSIRKDVVDHTRDNFWQVTPELNYDGELRYYVTNPITYDEDYGGEYDEFIEVELGKKYESTIIVTGIYGK